MIIKDVEFYAKCYFIIRRFPLGDEFYDNLYNKSEKFKLPINVKELTDKYCIDLMKDPKVMDKIQRDMDESMIPTNLRSILK